MHGSGGLPHVDDDVSLESSGEYSGETIVHTEREVERMFVASSQCSQLDRDHKNHVSHLSRDKRVASSPTAHQPFHRLILAPTVTRSCLLKDVVIEDDCSCKQCIRCRFRICRRRDGRMHSACIATWSLDESLQENFTSKGSPSIFEQVCSAHGSFFLSQALMSFLAPAFSAARALLDCMIISNPSNTVMSRLSISRIGEQ
jgi:hypothetical protein